MLAEMARADSVGADKELLALMEEQFSSFFGDAEVADRFLDAALLSETLPVAWLRERFEELDFDPDTFPVGFERAMNMFSFRLTKLVKAEASSQDSPINNLVQVAKLHELERATRELLRRAEPAGPSAEELERESWARCKRRWTLLGVPPEEAEALAQNPTVGAPSRRLREGLNRPVSIIAARVGSGKSLLLDRLMQRAIIRYREREDAPLPVFVEAARVENGLREAVVERSSALPGWPEERGATVFLDGLDEVDRAKARRLLDDAHYLPERWPNTTVVVAGRPMQELEEEKKRGEAFELPELTEGETEALIRRFSGDNRVLDALAYGWPSSVREAVRTPLFATLVGLDMRNRFGPGARSVGELLSHLVKRALRTADEAVELRELRDLAVAITDSGAGYVRSAEVGTVAQVQRLRRTGLVHEEGGAMRFSLQILSEWFAAQALELGEVDAEGLASDFARLERWRYPLVMAVGNFGHERVMSVFGPVVRSAPGFASQIVDAALYAPHARAQDGAPYEEAGEVARRFRSTMGAWVEGLGPLAPFSAPVRGDGSLGTLAISGWEGTGRYVWYAGPEELPEVVPFSRIAETDLRFGDWRPMWQRGYGLERQAAWAWRYTFKDLRSDLEEVLKAGQLPALTPMMAREAAWRAAKDILFRLRTRVRSENRPIVLDEIEACLHEIGAWDGDWIAMRPSRSSSSRRFYEVRHLVDEVRRLRAAGETEMTSPMPTFDLSAEEADEKRGDRETLYTWDLFSDEALRERALLVVEEALLGYERVVEALFPKLAPHMPMAATLPARLIGHLELNRGPMGDPNVSCWLDPLTEGSESSTEVHLGEGPEWEETTPYQDQRIAALRPAASGWLPPVRPYVTERMLLDLTPVTKTVHYWLWEDLEYAKWADGTNPWIL